MSNASCQTRNAREPRPDSSDVTVLASGIDTLHLFSRAPVARTELRRLLMTPSSRPGPTATTWQRARRSTSRATSSR